MTTHSHPYHQIPLVEFKNVSLGYGGRAVLTHIDLTIHRGDFIGVLGPNGAGKTTVLKTMLGLIPSIRGKLSFHGTAKAHKVRFGYVPQKERLDPIYPLSAYDVAAMGTFRSLNLLERLGGASGKGVVARCLVECGADSLADKRYSDLSGGQKQRVLIARALSAEPEFLVLDEPLAGIDVMTQKALLSFLQELKKKRDLTILMVSHRLQAEKDLFSHIAWVDAGKVDFAPAAQMLAKHHITQIFGEEF